MPDDAEPRAEFRAEVRYAYCQTSASIAEICTRFDLTPSRLRALRIAEGWPARPSAVAANAKRHRLDDKRRDVTSGGEPIVEWAGEQSSPRPATPSASPIRQVRPVGRVGMVRRLYHAIDLKLTQLERQMTNNPDTTAADHEREVRALSTLIQTFERMLEFDPASRAAQAVTDHRSESSRSGPHRAGGNRNDPAGTLAGSADAERLRREIMERVERVMEKRNPPGTAG